MATENNQNKYEFKKRKRSKKAIALLVIYSIVLLILCFYFIDLNFNPIIIISLFSFLFLVGLGVFFKRSKKSLYSDMFPDRKRKPSSTKQSRVTREKIPQPRIPGRISLDSGAYKPLIKKCQGCGNILPSFVKKCPFCNKQIT